MPCKIQIKQNIINKIEKDTNSVMNKSLKDAINKAKEINSSYGERVVSFKQVDSDFIDRSITVSDILVNKYYEHELSLEQQTTIFDVPQGQLKLFGLGLENDNNEEFEFHINTLNVINKFLENAGIGSRMVSEFLSQDGTIVEGAVAAANFIRGTVDIIEDINKRPEAWNKLPEEAAHFWYRLLDNSSELKKALYNSHATALKNDELYKTSYGKLVNDPDELTEESIGQLIAAAIKRIQDKNGSPEDYSFFHSFINWINSLIDSVKGLLNNTLFSFSNQQEFDSGLDPFEVAAMKILTSDMSDLLSWDEYSRLNNIVNFADVITKQSVATVDYTLIQDLVDYKTEWVEYGDNIVPEYILQTKGNTNSDDTYILDETKFQSKEDMDEYVYQMFGKEHDKRQKNSIQEIKDNQEFFDRLLNKTLRKKSRFLSKTIKKYYNIIESKNVKYLPDWNISNELQTITTKLSEKEKEQLINTNDYTNIAPTLRVLPNLLQKYKKIPIVLSESIKVDGAKKQELTILDNIKNMIKLENPNLKSITAEEFVNEVHNWLKINYLLGFANEKDYLPYRIDQTFTHVSDRITTKDIDLTNMTDEEFITLPAQERQRIATIMGLTKQNPDVYHNKVSLRFNDMYHLKSGHFSKSPSAWGNLTYFYTGKNNWKDAVLLHEIQNDNIEKLREYKVNTVDLDTSIGNYLQQLNQDLLNNIEQIQYNGKKIVIDDNLDFNFSKNLPQILKFNLTAWANMPLEQGLTSLKENLNERINLFESNNSLNKLEEAEKLVETAYTDKRIIQDLKNRGGIKTLLTKKELDELKNIIINLNSEFVYVPATAVFDDGGGLDTVEDPYEAVRTLSQKKSDFFGKTKYLSDKINLKLNKIYGKVAPTIILEPILKPRTKRQIEMGRGISTDLNDNISFLLKSNETRVLNNISKSIENAKKNYISVRNANNSYNFNTKLVKITQEQFNSLVENYKFNRDLLNTLINEQSNKELELNKSITESPENKEILMSGEVTVYEYLKQKALDKKEELKNKYGELENSVKQTLEMEMNYFSPLIHHLLQKHIKEYGKEIPMYFSGYNITKLTQGNMQTALIYAGKDEVDIVNKKNFKINDKSYFYESSTNTIPLLFTIGNIQFRHIKEEFSTKENDVLKNITEQEYNRAKQEYEKAYQQATERKAKEIKYSAALQLQLIQDDSGFNSYSKSVSEQKLEEGIKALNEYKKQSNQTLDLVIRTIMNINNNKPIETGVIYNLMSQIPGVKLIWQESIEGIKNNTGGYLVDLTNYNLDTPVLYGISESKQEEKVDSTPQSIEQEAKEASPKTITILKDFIKRIGVEIKGVDDIIYKGKKLSANGAALTMQKIIEIVNGKESQALPEEAMHFAVDIIQQKNPKLFNKLLKEINDYTIYKEVLNTYSNNLLYQTKEGKPDILKLKKEAIAQVLSEVIINHSESLNEYPEKVVKVQAWWQDIIDYLRELFTTNGFDKLALDILSKKDIGTASDIKNGDIYLQVEKTAQEKVFDDLKEMSSRISKKDEDYYIDGRKISRRVSNIVHDWYARRFAEKALQESEYDKAVNELKAEKGTAGHADFEHIFELFIDPITGFIRENPLDDTEYKSELNPNNNDMYDLLKENFYQRIKSFPKNSKFLSEITIYDSKRDIAGTVDFMVITEEGKVSILDWKFMDLNTDKYEDIPWYKINAWHTQMEQYKYIVSRVYHVKNENFQQTRMIPIKAIYTEKNYKTEELPILKSIKIGDINVKNINENYLLPVGLEQEKTGNKKIDTLLEKLNAIYKKLSEEKVIPSEKSAKAEQLNTLFHAIRQLQMKQNISPLLYQAKVLNKQVEKIINTYNTTFKGADKENFTEKEISDFSASLESVQQALTTYLNLDLELKFLFQGNLTDEELDLKDDLRNTVDDARDYIDQLQDIDKEFITNMIGGTFAPEKIVRGITKFFGNTATIQLEALKTLFLKANKQFAYIGMDVQEEIKKLMELKESYQEWAKNKGLKINNQFSIIKKKNSNELIDEYKPEFYSLLKKNITEKNYEWIRENTDVVKYKEYLDTKLEKEIIAINEKVRVGSTLEISLKIQREKEAAQNLYSISTPTSYGWLLYNDINKFPKKEIWESSEWIELHKKENKPALDFYNYIIEKNKEYMEIGYINAQQARVFLPWLRKGFTEKLIFNGNVSLGEQFLRNISIDEGDIGYGQIDPLTGKPINSIPRYFTKELKDDYSEDLFKNMALYNEMAIKFKYLTDIEAQGRALIRLEKNKKAIATSYFGKTETKDGVIQTNPDNTQNTKLVEDMVKAIIYQQRYIESDSFDQMLTTIGNTSVKINEKLGFKLLPENVEGRQVSINKMVTQLNNNFQIMTLGLNPLSSLSNLFGGKTQSFINSGKYFTKEDFISTEFWLLANKMNGSDKQKMLAALDYFIPFTENYNRDAPKKLSLNKLDDQAIQDYLMFMMRGSEDAVQKTNFFSYLKNSIVVNNKIVNTREYLKTSDEYKDFYKGTDEEIKIRKEKFEIDVKKLNEEQGVLKLGIVTNGIFSIPGIDRKSDSVIELRRKVQQITSDALGNLTEENKRLINLNVYGKSFMVFKNWIPRLVDVRMGNLKYNAASDAYEWGRTRMVYKLISEDFSKAITNLSNTLKGNEQGIEFIKQLFEKKREEYETDTGKQLEMTQTQFIDLVRQNTKNQIVDLLFYAGLFSMLLLMKALPPDDDEDPLVKNQYKFLLKATDKLKDEIGYFYDPTSITQIFSTGIFPSIQLLNNYKKALNNFMIENYAIAVGDEKLEKKTHVIKYWLKSFKYTNQMSTLLPLFAPELAKDLDIRMKSQFGIR